MLGALSRLFQASPAFQADHSTDKGKERASDVMGFTADSGVHLERKPSSHLSIPMERIHAPTPSHVSWKVPSPQPPSPASVVDPAWGGQYENHSASAPSLLLLNPASANAAQHRVSFRRHSSQSLRAHSLVASASEDSDRHSELDVAQRKRLSSIEGRVHFPVIRRPSLDSVPLTPDSTRGHDGHNASPYPGAFIHRPLNRSASQASTSTFRSTVSVAPPIIPPLDLRPNFQSTVAVPPRKSRLAVPTLPTVIGSPRPAKYSIIYEDGSSVRTSSFITAPSEHIPEHDDDGEAQPAARMREYAPSTGTEGTPAVRTSGLPEGLYDVDLTADPETRGRPHSGHVSSTQPLLGGPVAIPRRPRSVSPSDSESYILKRWLKGVSYGSDRFPVPPFTKQKAPITMACILFWTGFIGPWCWLIGGWVLSDGGEILREGKRSDTVLPLWIRRRKRRDGLTDRDKNKLLALKSWYPLVAPSVESLSPSVHSPASVTSARKMKKASVRGLDPWVTRCRIAAITSGALLLAVVVVALIVIGSRS